MSLKHLADELASRGRYGDTELVHMTKGEVAGLQSLAQAAGGSLTINPDTGKPEAFFLAALLPALIGGVGTSLGLGALGTAALGAGVGALQAKSQGRNALMGAITGGMGGMGGANIANALTNAGTTAAQAAVTPAAQAAGQNAVNQATADLATRQAMAQGAQLTGAEAAQAAMQGQVMPPIDLAAPNLDAVRNQAMGEVYRKATPQGFAAMGQGLQSLGSDIGRDAAMQSLGGGMGALKTAGMAATPYLYESMLPKPVATEEDDTELPRYDYTAGLTGDYYGMGGDNSTRERNYFTQPTFTRRAAQGGIMQLAEGGETEQHGG
jgi:hypothetical protein